jgi:hypothetical protein
MSSILATSSIAALLTQPSCSCARHSSGITALVEANKCRVDPANHDFVHTAGFSDAELGSIGGALVADSSAELAPDGTLILTTGSCL